MGTTYSNCQIRSGSQEAVVTALGGLLKESAYVAPAVNGWVGVYLKGGCTDFAEFAEQVSATSSAPAMASTVHDSDVFCYWLYESGTLLDEFNSDPNWPNDPDYESYPHPSAEEIARVQGQPRAIHPHCIPGVTLAQIQSVLHPATASEAAKKLITFSPASANEYLFADEQAADLAGLLGMDETLAALGYRYIEAGETGDYTSDEFLLMKANAIEGKAASSIARSSPSAGKLDTYANHIDERGEPLLVAVARLCWTESVQELIDGGAEVNIMTRPSYASIETGVTALIAAAGASVEHPTRQLETIQTLLDAGADVNARSETGRTALSEALRMTDPVRHQAKIGRRAPEDVLRQAAERSAQIVELLRGAGATE